MFFLTKTCEYVTSYKNSRLTLNLVPVRLCAAAHWLRTLYQTTEETKIFWNLTLVQSKRNQSGTNGTGKIMLEA